MLTVDSWGWYVYQVHLHVCVHTISVKNLYKAMLFDHVRVAICNIIHLHVHCKNITRHWACLHRCSAGTFSCGTRNA